MKAKLSLATKLDQNTLMKYEIMLMDHKWIKLHEYEIHQLILEQKRNPKNEKSQGPP